MYAKYSYKSTATQAQVLRDLILILTGTTNTGSLSASCDTANTSIDTTMGTTGNNNDHDPGASANTTQGLRMSVHDNATEYFYVALTIAAATLQIGLWDTWNGTSHVGVAPGALNTASMTIASVGTAPGTILLWSDGKSLLIGGSNTACPLNVMQFTRDDPWRTSANGCKPVACCGALTGQIANASTWSASSPFLMKTVGNTAAFVNAGTAYANTHSPCADVPNMGASANAFVGSGKLDASLVLKNTLWPVRAGAGFNPGQNLGGSVTSLSPVYAFFGPSGAVAGDDLTYSTETYRVMGGATAYRLCVRVA